MFSKSLWNKLTLGGASLLSLLPFLPFFLDRSRVLLYRDLSDGTFPNKLFWLRGWLEEGRIPRWTYLQSGGAPFYADLVSAPLYPLNALFLLFGPNQVPQALTLYIALHYPLFFLGLYFLLRDLGQRMRVALPLALTGAWCGYALSAHSMNHILAGVMALPWFVFFWRRALRKERLRDFFVASFFLALPIYGGDPQFTYIMAGGATCYALATHGLKAIRSVFILGVLSILCSAAQLLPTLELLRASQRADTLFKTWGDTSSIQPTRLADFLFPNFFGSPTREMDFWGGKFMGESKFGFYIQSLYLGFLPLFLGIWAICSGWAWHKLRSYWLAALVAIAFLLLSMGGFLHELFSRYLPLWNSFRYPERLAIYFVLIVLLITAPAFRSLYLLLRIARPKRLYLSLGASALSCLALASFFFWKFQDQPTHGAPQIHFLLMSFCALALCLLAKRISTRLLFLLWLGIVIADMAQLFPKNIWFQSESMTSAESYPAVGKITADLEKNSRQISVGLPHRMLSLTPGEMPWNAKLGPDSPLDPIGYSVLSHWEGMEGNIPSAFRIPSAQGFFALELSGMALLRYTLQGTRYGLLQNLFGVRYVLVRSADKPPEVKLNPDALPYFQFPDEILSVRTLYGAVDRFKNTAKNAEKTVLIESPWNLRQGERKPAIELISRDSTSARFLVVAPDMPEPVHFLWNESFYPAWHAYLGEKELPIMRANAWSMAVAFPPLAKGKYELEFRFDESPIRNGKLLTGLWILLLLATFIFVDRNAALGSRKGLR